MTKFITSLSVNAFVFALVAAMYDAAIAPLYDSVAVAFLGSALLTSLVMLVPAITIAFFLAFFLLALLDLDDPSFSGCLTVLVALPIMVLEFFVIRWLGTKFVWYPALPTSGIVLYVLASTLLNLLWPAKSKSD